jgi:phosphonoacetate hydrolase
VNEPIDRGAAYSTMDLVRSHGSPRGAGALSSLLPDPATSPYATSAWVAADPAYARWTQIDDIGLVQMLDLWASGAPGWPALTWWNSTLTDAALHGGGPRSDVARAALLDTDRRLGAFLDHLDGLGVYDDVVFVLTADHGFEATDEACRGDWDRALRGAGLSIRDEGPGFLYLGDV